MEHVQKSGQTVMLTQDQINKIKLDLYQDDPRPFDNIEEVLREDRFTCDACICNDECVYSFDPYNTDGDCLAEK